MKTITLPLRYKLAEFLESCVTAGHVTAEQAIAAYKTLRSAYTITEKNPDGTEKPPRQVYPSIDIDTDDDGIAASVQALADAHDPTISDEEQRETDNEQQRIADRVLLIRKALIWLLDNDATIRQRIQDLTV